MTNIDNLAELNTQGSSRMSARENILDIISRKNIVHHKALCTMLRPTGREEGTAFNDKAFDLYCRSIRKLLSVDYEFIADSYLTMVNDTTREQIHFMRRGKYRFSSFEEVKNSVYFNEDYMTKYMVGLAVSQFLWPNHRRIFNFFSEKVSQLRGDNFLEIGCGHGMFFLEAVKNLQFFSYKAVDLSPTSVALTKALLDDYFKKSPPGNVSVILEDIFDSDDSAKYDFIAMGEVLEHVEKPKLLLSKLARCLADNGSAFVSTCANSPAVDHISLFHDVDHIRRIIAECHLEIVSELSLVSTKLALKGDRTVEAVNYAAIVRTQTGGR